MHRGWRPTLARHTFQLLPLWRSGDGLNLEFDCFTFKWKMHTDVLKVSIYSIKIMKILCLKLKGKWAFKQCAINKYFIFNWNFSWEAKGTSCTSSLKGHTAWPVTREYLLNIVIRARYPSEWMMVNCSLISDSFILLLLSFPVASCLV